MKHLLSCLCVNRTTLPGKLQLCDELVAIEGIFIMDRNLPFGDIVSRLRNTKPAPVLRFRRYDWDGRSDVLEGVKKRGPGKWYFEIPAHVSGGIEEAHGPYTTAGEAGLHRVRRIKEITGTDDSDKFRTFPPMPAPDEAVKSTAPTTRASAAAAKQPGAPTPGSAPGSAGMPPSAMAALSGLFGGGLPSLYSNASTGMMGSSFQMGGARPFSSSLPPSSIASSMMQSNPLLSNPLIAKALAEATRDSGGSAPKQDDVKLIENNEGMIGHFRQTQLMRLRFQILAFNFLSKGILPDAPVMMNTLYESPEAENRYHGGEAMELFPFLRKAKPPGFKKPKAAKKPAGAGRGRRGRTPRSRKGRRSRRKVDDDEDEFEFEESSSEDESFFLQTKAKKTLRGKKLKVRALTGSMGGICV